MSRVRCVDFSEVSGTSIDANTSNLEKWTTLGQEVVSCLEEIGFLYISNHGIPQNVIENAYKVSQSFFDLPLQVKQKYARDVFPNNGYIEMSKERFQTSNYNQELRESFDVSRREGIFPDEIENFKESILSLVENGSTLFFKILTCLEIGLGIPLGHFSSEYSQLCSDLNHSTLRILNYPPVLDNVSEGDVRCSAHSDYGTLTLLFQDSCGGLEVKNRKGEWVKADPIPSTILVNVGDTLQMMTSGRLVATEHRVLIPDEEIKRRCARRSVVLFLTPDPDIIIRTLDGSPTEPLMTCGQYINSQISRTVNF